MSNVPHELAEEFPDQIEKLHDLKTGNAHFVKLSEEYHTINREIHRIEVGSQPTSEIHETDLRRKRMILKDEIASMLSSD